MLESNAHRSQWDDRRLSGARRTQDAALSPSVGSVESRGPGGGCRSGARDWRDLVKALRTEGLIEASARGAWSVTQAGRTFSVASAAKPVTRATAEKALAEFLDRVEQVNRDPYFLGKAIRVVLFGSMLKPEVMRLSDVDLAVELVTKEADFDRARQQNYRRAEELAEKGRQFRNVLDWELCWYFETRHFLKGGSRVIAMADYKAEKTLVLAVPHRFLIGEPEQIAAPTTTRPAPRQRRPRDCPF